MKENPHICMVGSSFTVRGGMTSVCKQLSAHEFGHGIRIHYVPTHEFGSKPHRCRVFALGFFRVLGLLLTGRADLLHLHMSERGSFYRKYMIHRLAKLFGKPDVVHMHGADFLEFYRDSSGANQERIRRMLRECDRVIVLGKYWDRVVHEIAPEAKTLVINNAVSIPAGTVHWDEQETRLCYMGVLIPRKGVRDLLDAMAILLGREDLPRKISLTVAGSGQEEEALKNQCRTLGIQDRVRFLGWTGGGDKEALLLRSHCFILPSSNEGLPVTILEALSCGLPVVSTDVGSIGEAVKPGENGLFVPVHDPAALAEAIFRTIQSKAQWTRFSQNARHTAEARFSEDQLFDQMERLYCALLEEK